MSIVPVVCANCKAALNVDNAKTTAVCEYCRTSFLIASATAPYQNNGASTKLETAREDAIPGFIVESDALLRFTGDDTEVIIPHGIVEIRSGAFNYTFIDPHAPNYLSLIDTIFIPESVRRIGTPGFSIGRRVGATFGSCTKLKRINIPDSIEYFEVHAFCGCANLTEITISTEKLLSHDWGINWWHDTKKSKTSAYFIMGEMLRHACRDRGICWNCRQLYNLKMNGKCKYCGTFNIPL